MKHPHYKKSKFIDGRFFRNVRCLGLSLSALCLSYVGLGFSSDVYAEPPSDGKTVESFSHELIDIEKEVSELKERVFQSKATLKLLEEIVIQGKVSDASVKIYQVNNMSNSFILESVSYMIDGKTSTGYRSQNKEQIQVDELKVFDGTLTPTEHKLNINLSLRGNGYGIIGYMDNYVFTLQQSVRFLAKDGQQCRVVIILKEHSPFTHSYFERPYFTYETECLEMSN